MNQGELILPALRGFFGDWVYYSCLMRLGDVARLVSYADELHKSRRLSRWIQRSLVQSRGQDIAKYLRTQPQRFFNSLVLAVYGGDPGWYEAGDIRPASAKVDLPQLPEDTRFSIGFLRFRGKERLFAVDGQHRLAGIKLAVEQDATIADDEASVLFIAHKNTKAGMERTRRLFTTLNKTPRHVAKRDIIALDEDDVMAIAVRYLVENHSFFSGDRVALNATANLGADDQASFTSIVALYDVLLALFREHPKRVKTKDLRFNRPEQTELDEYQQLAVRYFEALASHFPEVARYMAARQPKRVAAKLRGAFGGHILFRPVGLVGFARLATRALHHADLDTTMAELSRLPVALTDAPYADVLWITHQRRMNTDNAPLVGRILSYMLGATVDRNKLRRDYAKARGSPITKTRLPEQVSNILAR
jgi:DNA sulfur modification protein DndB